MVFHEAAVGILTLPSWLVKGVNTKLSLFVISQHLSEGSNATPCAKLLRIFLYFYISCGDDQGRTWESKGTVVCADSSSIPQLFFYFSILNKHVRQTIHDQSKESLTIDVSGFS